MLPSRETNATNPTRHRFPLACVMRFEQQLLSVGYQTRQQRLATSQPPQKSIDFDLALEMPLEIARARSFDLEVTPWAPTRLTPCIFHSGPEESFGASTLPPGPTQPPSASNFPPNRPSEPQSTWQHCKGEHESVSQGRAAGDFSAPSDSSCALYVYESHETWSASAFRRQTHNLPGRPSSAPHQQPPTRRPRRRTTTRPGRPPSTESSGATESTRSIPVTERGAAEPQTA